MELSELNEYGNYESGKPLPPGLVRVPTDGTIRRIKKAGIEYKEIVEVVEIGGRHYPKVVGYAVSDADLANLEAPRPKKKPKTHIDVLRCIHLAHEHYREGTSKDRHRKHKWMGLVERGIMALHQQGTLQYLGRTAFGYAVYAAGETDGVSCTLLHPAGVVERPIVWERYLDIEDGPPISLARIKATLAALPDHTAMYERLTPEKYCQRCQKTGHWTKDCTNYEDWREDAEDWRVRY